MSVVSCVDRLNPQPEADIREIQPKLIPVPSMTDQINIIVPEPLEELFDVKRDGLPEVISINSALLSFPHSSIFPWYLCITFLAEELIDNGMPSPTESALLFQLVDEIDSIVLGVRTVNNSQNALFLARSTWNGKRQLYYYVHDPKTTHDALQLALNRRKWEREWDYRMECDAGWENAGYVFQVHPHARGLTS